MVHHIIWAKTHIVASHYWGQSPHDDTITVWSMAQTATPSLTQLGSFLLTHLSTYFLICTSLNISQVTSSHNAPSMASLCASCKDLICLLLLELVFLRSLHMSDNLFRSTLCSLLFFLSQRFTLRNTRYLLYIHTPSVCMY